RAVEIIGAIAIEARLGQRLGRTRATRVDGLSLFVLAGGIGPVLLVFVNACQRKEPIFRPVAGRKVCGQLLVLVDGLGVLTEAMIIVRALEAGLGDFAAARIVLHERRPLPDGDVLLAREFVRSCRIVIG